MLPLPLVFCTGDAKSEDTANKEAGEEKPEEDNDYHRSDEQVSPQFPALAFMINDEYCAALCEMKLLLLLL